MCGPGTVKYLPTWFISRTPCGLVYVLDLTSRITAPSCQEDSHSLYITSRYSSAISYLSLCYTLNQWRTIPGLHNDSFAYLWLFGMS